MSRIQAIASYVPSGRVDNIAQAATFGESESFIRDKIGAVTLSRKTPEEETSDLGAKAVKALLEKTGVAASDIDALVVVTQNGDGAGLPHTSAILQHKAGLPSAVAAFDISLGCSGYVYGLAVVKGFMESTGMRRAILVTADPYSKIIDPANRVTTLLFGDAATATLLSPEGTWDIYPPVFGTDGSGAPHLCVNQGALEMNGRQVFNFTAMVVPDQIRACLSKNDLSPEAVDLYCLHQGSAAIIDAISRKFPDVRSRFVNDMAATGNTVSSTIPLLLEARLDDPAHQRILISGFGVGLSWATTIIQRKG